MARDTPTVRRRLLSIELRRLRDESGLTGTQIARRLNWHPSKLTRAERGEWRRPEVDAVAALLDVYGVADPRREELLACAHEGRRRGWWYRYQEVSADYGEYIGLEGAAAKIQTFQPGVIPGLLQTAAYGRALMAGRALGLSEQQITKLIEVRGERQRQLLTDTTDPVELWAILDEAILHRVTGGRDVMIEQLDHLLKMAELPSVTLQIVPNTIGAYSGSGPFVIMTFPDHLGPEAGYLETVAGPIWVEEDQALDRFRRAFVQLQLDALSGEATITLIKAIVAELRSARDSDAADSGMA